MTPFLLKLKRQNSRQRLISRFFGSSFLMLMLGAFYLATRVILWLGASEQYWCFERGVCP